ncbi:MAG: TIGR02646 family protein [Selenomonadaceae bacterium]|nr:TIGR02646 family protein [Selenomonadaceae bacterium]
MIKIDKGEAPAFLRDLKKKGLSYRDLPHSPYEHYINVLRKQLLSEQHGLCGYCCREVSLNNSHNEHMKAQKGYNNKTLEYNNIIASCNHENTCGKKKHGDCSDIVYPTREDCEQQFEFNEFDGSIHGTTDLANHTVDVLNLNEPSLCEARVHTLYGISWSSYQDVYDQCYKESLPQWLHYADIVRYVLREYKNNWQAFQQTFRGLYNNV